jgi:Ca-activated chloride channel homolog
MHFFDVSKFWLLLGNLLLLGLLYGAYLRDRRRLWALGGEHTPQLLSGVFSRGRYLFKALLILLAASSLVVALARPRWGYRLAPVAQGGLDLVVVVDLSASMLATDLSPSRLERAKRWIIDLLQNLEGDRLGVVVFGGVAFVQCPLTADYRLASLFVKQIDADLMPVQGTRIGPALELGLKTLQKASSQSSKGQSLFSSPMARILAMALLRSVPLQLSKGFPFMLWGWEALRGHLFPISLGGLNATLKVKSL